MAFESLLSGTGVQARGIESIPRFQSRQGTSIMTATGLCVYLAFSGVSMTIPYGTVENYQKAETLVDELTGHTGRMRRPPSDIFYLETKEQLDALFVLQRELGVKREP